MAIIGWLWMVSRCHYLWTHPPNRSCESGKSFPHSCIPSHVLYCSKKSSSQQFAHRSFGTYFLEHFRPFCFELAIRKKQVRLLVAMVQLFLTGKLPTGKLPSHAYLAMPSHPKCCARCCTWRSLSHGKLNACGIWRTTRLGISHGQFFLLSALSIAWQALYFIFIRCLSLRRYAAFGTQSAVQISPGSKSWHFQVQAVVAGTIYGDGSILTYH